MGLTAENCSFFLSMAAIVQHRLCRNLNQVTAIIVISKFISQGLICCLSNAGPVLLSFFCVVLM